MAAGLEAMHDGVTKGPGDGSLAEAAGQIPGVATERRREPTDLSDESQLQRRLADRRPPDVISFAGYLGDLVGGSTEDTAWRVLYLKLGTRLVAYGPRKQDPAP